MALPLPSSPRVPKKNAKTRVALRRAGHVAPHPTLYLVKRGAREKNGEGGRKHIERGREGGRGEQEMMNREQSEYRRRNEEERERRRGNEEEKQRKENKQRGEGQVEREGGGMKLPNIVLNLVSHLHN